MTDIDTVPVLVIDGPAGAGKSTVAVLVAKHLNYHLLVSGSLYRTLALLAIENHLSEEDKQALLALIPKIQIEFILDESVSRVHLNGSDVTDALRSEDCATLASRIAEIPELRSALLSYQHTFRRSPGLVAEGRDMGTVVFPSAKNKVFLTADLEERARRRLTQLNAVGLNGTLASLCHQLMVRDRRDRERCVAPLKVADDATVIDTTGKSIDSVVEEVNALVNS